MEIQLSFLSLSIVKAGGQLSACQKRWRNYANLDNGNRGQFWLATTESRFCLFLQCECVWVGGWVCAYDDVRKILPESHRTILYILLNIHIFACMCVSRMIRGRMYSSKYRNTIIILKENFNTNKFKLLWKKSKPSFANIHSPDISNEVSL